MAGESAIPRWFRYNPTTEANVVSEPAFRWGILGTAGIARKNWRAIQLTGNATVAGVASRDLERARRFIDECQAEAPMAVRPAAFGTYADLLASDVDGVYVPLPTGLRKPWVIRAADAGKHVVGEKPCAGSVADLREMLAACRRSGVQFMDGVMFMHSRRLARLREVLHDEEEVGQIRRLSSSFTFRQPPEFFTDNIRTDAALEPAGSLGDLGWYCIRFFLWALDWRMPGVVDARILADTGRPHSDTRVPTELSGELRFDGGVSAGFFCSFLTDTEQWAAVSGTAGRVHVPDFVLPFAGSEVGFDVHHVDCLAGGCEIRLQPSVRRVTVDEHSHGHATAQETAMFRGFVDRIRSGKPDPAWAEAALKTQIVMDACLASARDGGRAVAIG